MLSEMPPIGDEGSPGGFFDFMNDFKYKPHERDFALGLFSIIVLSLVILYCGLKIDADEKRYIERWKKKARARGLHVE